MRRNKRLTLFVEYNALNQARALTKNYSTSDGNNNGHPFHKLCFR